MDTKTLYEKVEKAFNQAFEAAKQSAKLVSEKAGEAAHITKLHIEKASLEHRIARKFSKLGSQVYEKAAKEGNVNLDLNAEEYRVQIDETRKLDAELAHIEALLEQEQRARRV